VREKNWRFLNTGLGNAFFNMALDEVLLRSLSEGGSRPTFRIYGWSPPAVSIGYSQRSLGGIDPLACRRLGIDIVRRMTGGRALLHWEELAFSFTFGMLSDSASGQYQAVSRALVSGLRKFGIPAELQRSGLPFRGRGTLSPCFLSSARYEIRVHGRKLVGSAQRRCGMALLHHGSILLGPAHTRIAELMSDRHRGDEILSALALNSISLREALGGEPDVGELTSCLLEGVGEALGVTFEEIPLSDEEIREAEDLARTKYMSERWTVRL